VREIRVGVISRCHLRWRVCGREIGDTLVREIGEIRERDSCERLV